MNYQIRKNVYQQVLVLTHVTMLNVFLHQQQLGQTVSLLTLLKVTLSGKLKQSSGFVKIMATSSRLVLVTLLMRKVSDTQQMQVLTLSRLVLVVVLSVSLVKRRALAVDRLLQSLMQRRLVMNTSKKQVFTYLFVLMVVSYTTITLHQLQQWVLTL